MSGRTHRVDTTSGQRSFTLVSSSSSSGSSETTKDHLPVSHHRSTTSPRHHVITSPRAPGEIGYMQCRVASRKRDYMTTLPLHSALPTPPRRGGRLAESARVWSARFDIDLRLADPVGDCSRLGAGEAIEVGLGSGEWGMGSGGSFVCRDMRATVGTSLRLRRAED